MKIKHQSHLALFTILLLLHASPMCIADANAPDTVLAVDPTGSFLLDGIPFTLAHYDHQWIHTTLSALTVDAAKTSAPVDGTWTTHGTLPIKDKSLSFDGEIKKTGNNQYHLLYKANLAAGLPTEVVCLELDLPIEQTAGKQVLLDGQPFTLPTTVVAGQALLVQNASKLVVPSLTGTITVEGILSVYLQDERNWNGTTFKIRLELAHDDLTTATGPVPAQIDVNLTYTPTPAPK